MISEAIKGGEIKLIRNIYFIINYLQWPTKRIGQ